MFVSSNNSGEIITILTYSVVHGKKKIWINAPFKS